MTLYEKYIQLKAENAELKNCIVETQNPRGTMKTVAKKIYNFDNMKKELEQLKAENERLKEESKNYCKDFIEASQQLKGKDELLNCYKDEEIKIAGILGNKHMTLIGCRMQLDNILKKKDEEIERLKVELSMEQVEKESAIKFGKARDKYSLELVDRLKQSQNQKAVDYFKKLDALIEQERYNNLIDSDVDWIGTETILCFIKQLEKELEDERKRQDKPSNIT